MSVYNVRCSFERCPYSRDGFCERRMVSLVGNGVCNYVWKEKNGEIIARNHTQQELFFDRVMIVEEDKEIVKEVREDVGLDIGGTIIGALRKEL